LNDNVFLLSEHEPVIIESALYAKLGQLLDGEHSVSQIVESMDGSYTMPQILSSKRVDQNELQIRVIPFGNRSYSNLLF